MRRGRLGVWRVVGAYGYMESPDVSTLMERVREQGVPLKLAESTYYFNREMIITGGDAKMCLRGRCSEGQQYAETGRTKKVVSPSDPS